MLKFRMSNSAEMLDQDYLKWKVPRTAALIAFESFLEHVELILMRFSRGDSVADLVEIMPRAIFAMERSVAIDLEVLPAETITRRHDVSINRNRYQLDLWMVALAICFDVDDEQFARIVRTIGKGGEDAVVDRLIRTRMPDRVVADGVLWPKPFATLLAAIDAPVEQQAALMERFLTRWYTQSRKVYWWNWQVMTEERNPRYFGYWSVEAAAVVAAFGIDDSGFRDNVYYPKDLAVYTKGN